MEIKFIKKNEIVVDKEDLERLIDCIHQLNDVADLLNDECNKSLVVRAVEAHKRDEELDPLHMSDLKKAMQCAKAMKIKIERVRDLI